MSDFCCIWSLILVLVSSSLCFSAIVCLNVGCRPVMGLQGWRWGGEFPDSDQTPEHTMVSVRDELRRCSAWGQTQVSSHQKKKETHTLLHFLKKLNPHFPVALKGTNVSKLKLSLKVSIIGIFIITMQGKDLKSLWIYWVWIYHLLCYTDKKYYR